MHWSCLSEHSSKRYRHLHASINTFRSLLNLINIWIILWNSWSTLTNILSCIFWWGWINSGRLSSNYHIIMFRTIFSCSWYRSDIILRFRLKMSEWHSPIIRFKSIIDNLIFDKDLLILHKHMFWSVTLLWNSDSFIYRLALRDIS